MRENLATLYGAVDDGALPIALPDFVRSELGGYLDCGLLCRGFARLKCEGYKTDSRLVECVLPEAPLRQWVLTLPFAWRKRLGYVAPLVAVTTPLCAPLTATCCVFGLGCGSALGARAVGSTRSSVLSALATSLRWRLAARFFSGLR